MREAAQFLTWLKSWRHLEKGNVDCGLQSCSEPKSRWARFRHRGHGTTLQGVFYCSRQCLETALISHLARMHALRPAVPPSNRIPLGLLMVARGWLTHEQVATALEAQRGARCGQIGEWFEQLGFATAHQVTTALGLQWGCPVTFALDSESLLPVGPIPLGILEAFQMVPLQFVAASNTVYIAFGQRVDHAALYAIERLLHCRTQPCVAGRKAVAEELIRMRQQPRPREVEFGTMHDFAEIGRVSVSYMLRLGAEEACLDRVGDFIWMRLRVGGSFTDLLFRVEIKKQSSVPGSRFSERPLLVSKDRELRTGNRELKTGLQCALEERDRQGQSQEREKR